MAGNTFTVHLCEAITSIVLAQHGHVKADYNSIAQNVLALVKLRSCTVLYFTEITSYIHSGKAGCILMYALVITITITMLHFVLFCLDEMI